MEYNSIISNYTNGEYTFDTLREANANELVEPSYLAGLIRLMVSDVVKEKRLTNKFAQFKRKRGYSGKIINSVYVNPADGKEFKVDGLSRLFDLAPADVKSSISKYTKPLQYDVDYNKDELRKAFSSEEELTRFLNSLISSLYNGSEIDDKNEFIKLFNDMIENNLVRFETVDTVTGDATKDLAIKIKTIVNNFKEESDKFNVWKRLNPTDTHATFWSNPEDINILLPIKVDATLEVGLYASLFNVDRAELDGRVFTVADDKINEKVKAIIFDSTLISIEEIYAELEPAFYDSTKRRFKEVYNTNNQYAINPFANCVVILDNSNNKPVVEPASVRSKTVNVKSGELTNIPLEVVPIGANQTLTPTATSGSTVSVTYSDDTGYTLSVTATASDSITFGSVSGTITINIVE